MVGESAQPFAVPPLTGNVRFQAIPDIA
jgi:hypothetical protein